MEENISKTITQGKSNKIIPIIILSVIAGGVFLGVKFMESKKSPAIENNPSPISTTPTPSGSEDKAISMAEIEKHSSATDCWFAIEGDVYDVTSFIASGKHPGGEEIIKGCGKDATVLFNTRPMGSGTPHSDRAKSMLGKFKIGTLAK